MLKKTLAIIAVLFAGAAFAAVDVNTANEAELDGIKGIGPGLSSKILSERTKGDFKDWNDFIGRVGGVGNKTAIHFSREGLTVGGKKYSAADAIKSEKRSEKQGPAFTSKSTQDDAGRGTAQGAGASPATPAPTPTPTPVSPVSPVARASAGATKN